MAQINLLTPNTSKPNLGQTALSLSVKLLAVLLVLILAYYGWLIYLERRIAREIIEIRTQIDVAQASILERTDREQLIVRQGQIKALQNLIDGHLYWSEFFPKLAAATLKSASYSSFSANADGTATLVVSVANYTELDKFLQVFDLPEFNNNFSDVKVSSINRSQNGDALATRAELRLKFRDGLLRRNENTK